MHGNADHFRTDLLFLTIFYIRTEFFIITLMTTTTTIMMMIMNVTHYRSSYFALCTVQVTYIFEIFNFNITSLLLRKN